MLDPDAHYYFEAAPSADYHDFGSNGVFGDDIGQEITSFEATQDLFAPRVSYEAQTFGWGLDEGGVLLSTAQEEGYS